MTPRVSVILALRDPAEDPEGCLSGLASQTPGSIPFEVVIGCRGLVGAVARARVHGLDVRSAGGGEPTPGAAWNTAARAATGDILLFLPPWVVPDPSLLNSHCEAHSAGADALVLGSVSGAGGWRDRTGAGDLRNSSSRASPAEYEGQTLSLMRAVFEREGGFDQALGWGVEIELAHRLAVRGLLLGRAKGRVATQARLLEGGERADARFKAGRGNVELYRHTPALLPFLELGTYRSAGLAGLRLRSLLLVLGGPRLPAAVGSLLPRGRWRERWEKFEHEYAFWRGAMRAIPQRTTRRSLIRPPVILMYHALGRNGEAPGCYRVPARRFGRHMWWLALRRYRVLSLEKLLDYRQRHELPPPRSVVITFDDGYADNHDLAYPVLRERGFGATFFLVSGRVGARNDWDASGELAGRALLSWNAVRELLAGGMEVGAHTRSHPVLPELARAEIDEQVVGARRELEEALARPVRAFAYPFGRFDDSTIAAVERAGFEAACCSRSGGNDPSVPPLLLRRVEIRGTDSLWRFALAVHDGRAVRGRRPR